MSEDLKKIEDKPKIPRITGKTLFADILSILNFEKGVFYTLRGLVVHPYRTIREYLTQNRRNHANPIRLLMFSTALYAFLSITFVFDSGNMDVKFDLEDTSNQHDLRPAEIETLILHVDSLNKVDSLNIDLSKLKLEDLERINIKSLPSIDKERIRKKVDNKIGSALTANISKYNDKLILILVPVYGLLTFLFFRKKGYNFIENLVINTFLISLQNVVGVLLIPLLIFFPIVTSIVFFLAMTAFSFYFWMDVFGSKNFVGFVLSLSVFLLSYVVYMTLIVIFFLIYLFDTLEFSLI